MEDTININSGDVRVASPPVRLHAPALGSCIAVVLYDGREKIGGMAHVMLPSSEHYVMGEDPLKYADEAIPYLLRLMVEGGVNRYGLHARLVGGAMITKEAMDIGAMVKKSVEEELAKLSIEVTAHRTGGCISRTATLDTGTGALWYSEDGGVEMAL
jgi:chemotaxis protein CheD